MKSYKSSSSVKPPVWDKESSKTCVYHNINVEETTDSDGGKVYIYDVEEYTNKEFIIMQSQQIEEQADALIELAELIVG